MLFCSPAHRQAEYRDRLRRYGEATDHPAEWRCEHCGKDLAEMSGEWEDMGYKPLRRDARFCHSDCRVAAHRARVKAEA